MAHPTRLRALLPAAGLAVLLATVTTAAPAQTATPAEGSAAAGPGIVIAKDFMFAPTSVMIKAGATVTWKNTDDEPHTVVSDTGLFRSGALDTNESFSFRFDKPGTYHYACSIHPRMVGTIVVQ
jgi:plastocyanin